MASVSFEHSSQKHLFWEFGEWVENGQKKVDCFKGLKYCTPFWCFTLGVDVLKNIYLWYKYQKPNQYIFTALFSEVLLKTDRFVLSN